MKNIFALTIICASMNSWASNDLKLTCTAIHNLDKVVETEVVLSSEDKNRTFGEYQEFKFIISSKQDEKVEIQSLNINEPSRTYATGQLSTPGSYVELSVWNREYILDVRCTR